MKLGEMLLMNRKKEFDRKAELAMAELNFFKEIIREDIKAGKTSLYYMEGLQGSGQLGRFPHMIRSRDAMNSLREFCKEEELSLTVDEGDHTIGYNFQIKPQKGTNYHEDC